MLPTYAYPSIVVDSVSQKSVVVSPAGTPREGRGEGPRQQRATGTAVIRQRRGNGNHARVPTSKRLLVGKKDSVRQRANRCQSGS